MGKRQITIKGKRYNLPIFFPDATRAVTKGVGFDDLERVGIEAVMVNTYHLMKDPGGKLLGKMGGFKGFANFNGLVASDSGGWQILSLIHRDQVKGGIGEEGVFMLNKRRGKIWTSPEEVIRAQFEVGADIIICLDEFDKPGDDEVARKRSVERTIRWARRSKQEYEKIVGKKKLAKKEKPMLMAVVQGGLSKKMRLYCAAELMKIGFEAYGFGGEGVVGESVDWKLAKELADFLPRESLKFALGVGRPRDVVECFLAGWDMFDCTLPTRNARHGGLYVFKKEAKTVADLRREGSLGYLYIERGRYKLDQKPVDEHCDCLSCKNHSRAYLHHLFKIGDTLAYRLASIHNLAVYVKIIGLLRRGG